MPDIIGGRMSAKIDGDFVVFLIGLRLNRIWNVAKWLPAFMAMPRMLAELGRAPELGLLHARVHLGLPNAMVVQYWRSFAHLHRYATDPTLAHVPAWRALNRAVTGNADLGLWHETYLVRAGAYEAVYVNMPRFGLGCAGNVVPADGPMKSAKARLGMAEESEPNPPPAA